MGKGWDDEKWQSKSDEEKLKILYPDPDKGLSGNVLFGIWVVCFLIFVNFAGVILAPLFSVIGAGWMR